MPVIYIFDGIKIMMYFYDHAPPHVHIDHGGITALLSIHTGEPLERSKLSTKILNKAKDWILENQSELLKLWEEYSPKN